MRRFARDEAERIVAEADPERDVVLILSSGSFDGALTEVIEAAERLHPAP